MTPEETAPHLGLEHVRDTALHTAERLFNIRFEALDRVPAYHPDCRGWLVKDSAGQPLGLFLGDWRAREHKGGGAWMNDILPGHGGAIGPAALPVVVNVCSFGSTLDMVQAVTLFHELGHALHSLLSKARFPGQAGTRVLHDWVKLPSQLMENWVSSERGLLAMGVPQDLAQRLVDNQQTTAACSKVRYLQVAQVDLALHGAAPIQDVLQDEKQALDALGADARLTPWHRSWHFCHLWADG